MSAIQLILVVVLSTVASLSFGQTTAPPVRGVSVTTAPTASTLPDGPEKALVVAYCEICHDLAWIERSGGTEQGWNERIKRMIRAGATIPPDQIPAMAAYLAKFLPERPRPPPLASSPTNRRGVP